MRKFTDNQQNQWAIEINIGTVIDVQEELKINLLDPSTQVDGLPLPAKFITDDLFVSKLVAFIIKDQLDKNGVSEKQFYKNLDAKAVQGMGEAFVEEYKAFFMSRGRKAVAQGVEEMQKAALEMFDIPLEQSMSKSDEAVSQSPTQES